MTTKDILFLKEKEIIHEFVLNRKGNFIVHPPSDFYSRFYFIKDDKIFFLLKSYENDLKNHLKRLIERAAEEYISSIKEQMEKELKFQLPDDGNQLRILKKYYNNTVTELENLVKDDFKDLMYDDDKDQVLEDIITPYLDYLLIIDSDNDRFEFVDTFYNVILNLPKEDASLSQEILQEHLCLKTLIWIIEQIKVEETLTGIFCNDYKQHPKDKLSHKQQLILLEKLGILSMPFMENLTSLDRAKLLSHLLNRSQDNTEDYLRYISVPKKDVPKDAWIIKTPENIQKVNQLLKEIGLNKF